MIDRMVDWLMRPKVRRLRRWSFVLTLPAAVVVARLFELEDGLLVVAVRLAMWAVVAAIAWQVKGDRGEAVRDLLMHPRARAYMRAELDVLCMVPRLLFVRARSAGMGYHRGTYGAALAFAFTPAVAAEGVVFHLILGGGRLAWAIGALHVYSLIWLWGYALGARAFPHRVGTRAAIIRNGAWYRVRVPLDAIAKATAHRERVVRDGLQQRDGTVLLASRRRVDVLIELSAPVRIQRPFHEPIVTRTLAVASDDPDDLIARLLAPAPAGVDGWTVAWTAELATLARDAAQPG